MLLRLRARFILWLLIVFLTTLPARMSPSPANAGFEPPPPLWFSERLRLPAELALPRGVHVTVGHEREWDYLLVGNISETPVLLLRPPTHRDSDPRPPDLPATMPEGMIATEGVEHGRSVAWDQYRKLWRVNGSELWLQARERNSENPDRLYAYAPELEDRNRSSLDRPEPVVLPESQQARLTALYGDQPLEIPFELYYEPNPRYEEKAALQRRWRLQPGQAWVLVLLPAYALLLCGAVALIAGILFAVQRALQGKAAEDGPRRE